MENIFLQYPTGFGKTKSSLDICKSKKYHNVLCVVPLRTLVKNWREELIKWNFNGIIEFSTYNINMLAKFYKNKYDCVIFDEAHHITENNICYIKELVKNNNTISLSASLNKEKKDLWDSIESITYDVKTISEAIEQEKISNPTFVFIKLKLNKIQKKTIARINYTIKNSDNSKVQKIFGLKRLKKLSDYKLDFIKKLTNNINGRLLLFTSDIKSQSKINIPAVNSINKKSEEIIDSFNKGEIDKISCVSMLDEGKNLKNCQIGIIQRLTKSNIKTIQRVGRILRSSNPLIIIPYFIDTVEVDICKNIRDEIYKMSHVRYVDNNEKLWEKLQVFQKELQGLLR